MSNYVFNTKILNERQLYKAVGEASGATICRAAPPRQQDLDEWSAYELQPDNPPIGDVVTPLQTASQAQDGLWYRDYTVRAFTHEELTVHQEQAITRLNAMLDAKVEELADKFPRYEKETWPYQIEEASAWLTDNTTLTPTLDAIIQDGEDKIELCTSILTKESAYRELAAGYVKVRRDYRDAIRSAGNRADIDALIEQVRAL